MITLTEYNRRFDAICNAFTAGHFTRSQALDAIYELIALGIKH